MQFSLDGLSPKTYQDGSPPKTTLSVAFWEDWSVQTPRSSRHLNSDGGVSQVWCLVPSAPQRGASSMLSISAWRRDGGASLCSLSEVLETGSHLSRYCLSPKACAGILRRAAKRGKDLPAPLAAALQPGVGS